MNNTELETFRSNYCRLMEGSALRNPSSETILSRAIRETHIKEENSNQVLCYMGPFVREKTQTGYVNFPTYEGNYHYTYKKYIDIETEKIYDIERENVEEFESSHLIVYPKVIMNNLDEYLKGLNKAKACFFGELLTGSQSKALKVVLKSDFN